MPKKSNIQQIPELDLFSVQAEYPEYIVKNEPDENFDELDLSKNVLICNVKKDNMQHFLDGTAKIYYTGKRFPNTIHLNKLYYFIPYIGKQCDLDYYGIRDLYLIKVARTGSRREGELDHDPNDLRIVFELQFVKHLFSDYRKQKLQIWDTFTDTTLEELQKAQKPQRQVNNALTYISLFSSAGVGCYGFKQENYNCVATCELIERRLNVQKYNHKCLYDSEYICGDITLEETQQKVFDELHKWQRLNRLTDLDVLREIRLAA